MKVDLIPNQRGTIHVFYFKSSKKTPSHYFKHPLLDGKIEFFGKIEFIEDLNFWFNFIFDEQNPKKSKGKNISVLVEFEPSNTTKFILKGIGKKDDHAYLFNNKTMTKSPEENMALLNFVLPKTKTIKSKLIKV